MRIVVKSAWAKINLGLKILGKRPDGYHDIETQFQRISLADVVALFPYDSGIIYTGAHLTDDPSHNLSVMAARLFMETFEVKEGIEISLTKTIPIGAGLGGGSSDAATVLRCLADLNGINLPDDRVSAIAAKLGADVSFFLADLKSAIGKGLGEVLTPAEGLGDDKWIVILWPGFQVSTAQAYHQFDNSLTEDESIANLRVRSLSIESGSEDRRFINDFEPIIFSAHPILIEARDKLLQAGAISAGLAGSGSSLFAIFDGETKARNAASTQRQPWQSFVCRPC